MNFRDLAAGLDQEEEEEEGVVCRADRPRTATVHQLTLIMKSRRQIMDFHDFSFFHGK